MGCCSCAVWKHLCASGAITRASIEAGAAAYPRRQAAGADDGVTILYNGNFLLAEATMGGESITAVAFQGETIIDVGDYTRINGEHSGATFIDLGGNTLAPGFIEAHAHLVAAVENLYSTSLAAADCPTFEAVRRTIERTVAAAIAAAKPGEPPWCFFVLFDPSLLEWHDVDGFPQLSFDVFDTIKGNDEANIFVENASGHLAYANRLAYQTARVTLGAPPYLSDGAMLEPPSFTQFLKHRPPITFAETRGAMVAFLATCQQVGVTTVADPAVGIGGSAEGELILYESIAAGRDAPTDIVGSLDMTSIYALPGPNTDPPHPTPAPPYPPPPPVVGLNKPDGPGATGSFGELIIPGMKLWADGSTQGYTGYLTRPYLPPVRPEGLSDVGEADWTFDQMKELLQQAKADRWGMQIHANGDRGLGLALDAIDSVYGKDSGYRHRIEHCTVTEEIQYDTMASLGVTPTYLMNHVRIWGDPFRLHILGEDRAARLDAVSDALVFGMDVSFHCDYATSNPGPLQYMQTAVTRQTSSGYVLGKAYRIGALEALKAITIYPARQLGIHGIVGTITKGKRANFVQLGADPTTCPSSEIASTPVIATYLRGQRHDGPTLQ